MFTDLPPITGKHIINNRSLNWNQDEEAEVGELPVRHNGYRRDSRIKLPAGLTGNHVCQSDLFAVGATWPYTGPLIDVDEEDMPTCCERVAHGAVGGVAVGGSAGDRYTMIDTTDGGVAVGVRAGDNLYGPMCTRGGVAVGGTSGDVQRLSEASSGGIAIVATCGDMLHMSDAASGGGAVASVSGDVLQLSDATSGGSAISANADGVSVFTDPTTGGVSVGGSTGDRITGNDAATGGVAVGGSAGDVYGDGRATGGVSVGGSAGDVYDDGTPSGDSCPTAVEIVSPFAIVDDPIKDGGVNWYRVDLPSVPGTITTWPFTSSGSPVVIDFYRGTCDALTGAGAAQGTSGTGGLGIGASGAFLIRVVGTPGDVFNLHFAWV